MAQVDSDGNPVPFTGTAVTCDLERNRGGEKWDFTAVLSAPGGKRKAYRNRNDVRNIKLIPSNEIRGIDPILITEFNGKTVYL